MHKLSSAGHALYIAGTIDFSLASRIEIKKNHIARSRLPSTLRSLRCQENLSSPSSADDALRRDRSHGRGGAQAPAARHAAVVPGHGPRRAAGRAGAPAARRARAHRHRAHLRQLRLRRAARLPRVPAAGRRRRAASLPAVGFCTPGSVSCARRTYSSNCSLSA